MISIRAWRRQREQMRRDRDKRIEKLAKPQDREEINRRLRFIDARIANFKRSH